jgi:aryl-alcohol dehydrogenase-like predicted oxidoreductase
LPTLSFPTTGLLIATRSGYERIGLSSESSTGELIGWTHAKSRPEHLRSICEESLRRAGLERIDI